MAQGGPPLITDDPGTPGNRHWEINTAITLEQRPGIRTYETPLLDVNYGYGDRIQLKWEVPWVAVKRDASGTLGGLGNNNVGIKWRFQEFRGTSPALSVYPQLQFNNPTSSARRGIIARGAELFVPVELAVKLGRTWIDSEIGRTIPERGPGEWMYGLVVSRIVPHRTRLLVEVHGDTDSSGATDLLVNLGARYRLDRHHYALLAVGRSVAAPSGIRTSLLTYVGLQTAL